MCGENNSLGGMNLIFNGEYRSVNTVLFDLDGTLRHNQPSFTQAFYDHAVRLGVEDSPEKRRKAARWTHYYWAQSAELAQDSAQYNEQGDPFWVNYALRSLLAFDVSPDTALELAPDIHAYIRDFHHSDDVVPADVPEVLSALRAAGFRLGVVSNRSQPYRVYLEELQLAEYFELILAAGEVDIWKPDPEIFHHALAQMQTTPEKTLYVGDNYYADIVGAQNAGLLPVLVDPDGVFPDVECPTICTLGELQGLLEHKPDSERQ